MTPVESFGKRVDIELKRAQRYSIFISMTVFDLSFLKDREMNSKDVIVQDTVNLIQKNVREIDNVALIDNYKIGLLFPETQRQGAEIASRRIADVIRDSISHLVQKEHEGLIPLEMLSYPDAAGAKSLSEFLEELVNTNRN